MTVENKRSLFCSHDYDLDVAGTATSVTCTVTVSDGDLKDAASLVVTINDVNDNTPTFGSSVYTFYASPYTSVGTVLGSIAATDADIGAFGLYNLYNFLYSLLLYYIKFIQCYHILFSIFENVEK